MKYPAILPGRPTGPRPQTCCPSPSTLRRLAFVHWRCRCERWVSSTGGPATTGWKIALTIFAFLAGWVLFVIVGNSWTTLAVAALVGIIFTQLGFIGHDAGHNQVFGTRRAIACSASPWETCSSG